MKIRPETMPPDNDIQMSAAHPDRFRTPEAPPSSPPEVPGNIPPVQG